MSALRRIWSALPGAMRLGFGVLALGLLLDVAYHAVFGMAAGHDAGAAVPLAIHSLVAFGMGLCLLGVASAAFDHRRRSPGPEGGK